jgi:hypothetical protein
MINNPLNLLNGGALLFGGILSLTVAATGPQDLSSAVAASGGLIAGTAAATQVAKRRSEQEHEKLRVARAFTMLYRDNRGILLPQELAFEADADLQRIDNFLTKLAESQGGQKVTTDQGTFYKFPHQENILDQLSANASAWAQKQVEGYAQENTKLKQQLVSMQMILTQMPIAGKAPMPIAQNENTQESVDPWEKLL